ncbi:MAG TPA: class I SAM-dependent methyltransferase [Conexibacter sp.]|nr:class I SAM-dependent methyltransferase [Conexibacter sp.]
MTTGAASPRPAATKSQAEVCAEWDAIADARFEQIRGGLDVSYTHVLTPAVIGIAGDLTGRRVVDAGCGAGFLTRQLAARAASVVGVDPSARQIALAEAHHSAGNARFVQATLEAYAAETSELAEVVVANMALMDALDVDGFLRAARRLLVSGGRLVASLTHPCFWPSYWGYADASWFAYERETVIEAPFSITLAQDPVGWTTHVHRPLERYISSLHGAGLELERLVEPMPDASAVELYPVAWRVPRYLVVCCRAGADAR